MIHLTSWFSCEQYSVHVMQEQQTLSWNFYNLKSWISKTFDIFALPSSLIHRLARSLSKQKLIIQNQLKNKSGLRAPYGLSGK